MLLTKDNLQRYVRDNKYTTPTHVAREFETTTTIASAALGELTTDNSVLSTHLKYGSTPYYYDSNQKECLIEIAQYHFTGNELELFEKIKNEQIISINALTIPQRSIITKLQDIYYTIEISKNDKKYTFYIWYLRDEKSTRQQIQDAFSPSSSNSNLKSQKTSSQEKDTLKQNTTQNNQPSFDQKNNTNNSVSKQLPSNSNSVNQGNRESNSQINPFSNLYSQKSINTPQSTHISGESYKNKSNEDMKNNQRHNYNDNSNTESQYPSSVSEKENSNSQSTSTQFRADSYLYQHAHTIIEKEKHPLGTKYKTSMQIHSFVLYFDSLSIEQKKVQPHEIISFYTSSLKPKIIFHTNLPKKIEQLIEELDNCFLVKIES